MRVISFLTMTFVAGIKYLKSRRGKVIMVVNTFPFCEESKLRDKVIWRCTSKKTNCKARIHMLGANVVAVKGMHNHPPRKPLCWSRLNNLKQFYQQNNILIWQFCAQLLPDLHLLGLVFHSNTGFIITLMSNVLL